MKQKFLKAAVVLGVVVLGFGLTNKVAAQSTENTNTQPNAVKFSNQAEYINAPDANISMHKTPTGAVKVDDRGNVTVLDAATQQVTVFVKPLINLEVAYGSDYDAYVDHYTKWLKANPDYAKFVTAQELQFIQYGDFDSLFKTNYLNAQHQAAANK